jgi:hypothetical protein
MFQNVTQQEQLEIDIKIMILETQCEIVEPITPDPLTQ